MADSERSRSTTGISLPYLLLPVAVLSSAAGAVAAAFVVRRELASFKKREQEGHAGNGKGALRPSPVPQAPPIAEATQPAAQQTEVISEEVLSVIAATVAAHLGKTARIRAIRAVQPLSASSAWAQQARVSVQASHNLGRRA